MLPFELKFKVPDASQREVDATVGARDARRTRLQVVHFDTPDGRLATAGLALELRKQGRCWVQRLDAAGSNVAHRLEHTVPLIGAMGVPAGAVPGADPHRHAGTPVGEMLATALAPRKDDRAPPRLIERYRSDLWRRARTLRTEGGTVALALERGEIHADDRRWPSCELKIDLVRGRPDAAIEVARRWVHQHGLWLDLRGMSECGDRLAHGMLAGPAVKAGAVKLESGMSANDVLHAVLGSCLQQILPNASEIAGGQHGDEHVHQLRVGLRRLRTALRFFAGWTTATDPTWDKRLGALFRQLGVTRDRDALVASLLPELRAADAPLFELPPAPEGPSPTELMRKGEATLLLLDLIAYQFNGPLAPPQQAAEAAAQAGSLAAQAVPPLADAVALRLQRWHRRVTRGAKRYGELDDVARHRLRKGAKRLRYAAEFVAPLYEGKAVTRYLRGLEPVQECLGRYNDLCVGLETYRGMVDEDPRSWFAIGWLTARRDVVLAEGAAALQSFVKCKPFWTVHPEG